MLTFRVPTPCGSKLLRYKQRGSQKRLVLARLTAISRRRLAAAGASAAWKRGRVEGG